MTGWKLDKLCKGCDRKCAVLVSTPAGPRCRKCKPASKPGRKARIENAVERAAAGPPDAVGARDVGSPLAQYLGLHAAVETMKARHKTELHNALQEITRFETSNTDVVDGARAVYERIFASGKLLLSPPDASNAGEAAP